MCKNLLFRWNKNQEQTFQKLKDLITEAPVLQFYNSEKSIQIETNASKLVIIRCLIQPNNNNK